MFENPIVMFVIKTLIPLVFVYLVPNKWWKKLGQGAGVASSKGLNKLTLGLWEFIEDHVIGSAIAFFDGFKIGADKDDLK